jgi:hypothetical protein
VGTDNAEENWQITSQDLGLKPDRPFSVRTRILLEICGREWNENCGFFSRSNDHCLPFHRDLKNPKPVYSNCSYLPQRAVGFRAKSRVDISKWPRSGRVPANSVSGV